MVYIPDENIRRVFTRICASYQRKIEVLKEQINTLSEARDRLLPKLMSGEIAV